MEAEAPEGELTTASFAGLDGFKVGACLAVDVKIAAGEEAEAMEEFEGEGDIVGLKDAFSFSSRRASSFSFCSLISFSRKLSFAE